MLPKRHLVLILAACTLPCLCAAQVRVAPAAGPPPAARKPVAITIGEDDIRPGEIANMKRRKADLADTAKRLADAAPETSDTVTYARDFVLWENDLREAKRLKWWNETADVPMVSPPPPTEGAREKLHRMVAEEKRRAAEAEAALREEQRRQREIELREKASSERMALERARLEQKEREIEEMRRRNDILENSYFIPYPPYYYPPPTFTPGPNPKPTARPTVYPAPLLQKRR